MLELVEITWSRVIRVFWALTWRVGVSVGIAWLITFALFLVIGSGSGDAESKQSFEIAFYIIVGAISLFFSLSAIRAVLNKNLGDFYLSIVKQNDY